MGPEQEKNNLGGLLVLGSGATGAGCTTIILLLGAIFVGQWLDRLLGTEPWLLLTLILAAIPLSLFMMVSSALAATRSAQTHQAGSSDEPPTKRPTNLP